MEKTEAKCWKIKILIVDDNHNFLMDLFKILHGANFDVIMAANASEGVTKARAEQPDLILLVVNMPRMNGFNVKMVLQYDPLTRNIPVIFLPALNDHLHTLTGSNMAEEYTHNPFDADILVSKIKAFFRRQGIGHRQAVVDAKQAVFSEDEFQEWGQAVEIQDIGTAGHTQRVTRLFMALARGLGLSGEELESARKGAMLHDIGKLAVPEAILNKPGPLNKSEWEVMRAHPLMAYKMLAPVEILSPAIHIPMFHHEHWNGRGYPHGLAGENIPLVARIFTVVDMFDTLITKRADKDGFGENEALEMIKARSGKQFDPEIVNYFITHLCELKAEANCECEEDLTDNR